MLAVLYGVLLIPESAPPTPKGAGLQAFLWNRDAFWSRLESKFQEARTWSAEERKLHFNQLLERMQRALDPLTASLLPPGAPAYEEVEVSFFELTPVAAVCPDRLTDYLGAAGRLRELIKWQSKAWALDTPEARQRLYRLLYGSRAAVEEVLLQSPPATNALELAHGDVHDVTPSAEMHGIQIHSGDILVSRGGAATSALIARGNDFPGNFSHVALVHVNDQTREVSVIESHIESGVEVRPIEEYLADTKLRILVLRLNNDLPPLATDALLPHQAASLARSNALARHIPYDFAMDHADPGKQFCSEVAAAAYQPIGVTLWMNLSHLSTPGVTSWLAALGVRNFETQEPSDLEYDPQLRVVAEWRDPATLFQNHVDNAVIDVMLEGAERGQRLGYNRWMLPGARLAKGWSVLLNWFGKVGPIPEGMSAATALRVKHLTATHATMSASAMAAAEQFKVERGYVPPYWELVRMAGAAHSD